MSRSVKVSQLKKGDVLASTGAVLTADPVYIGDYCGSKDRAKVSLRFTGGDFNNFPRIWGWKTEVKIKDTQN